MWTWAVSTPSEVLSLIAAGAQVEVRDEEWLVRQVQPTPADGLLVRCIGTSTLVRDVSGVPEQGRKFYRVVESEAPSQLNPFAAGA